MRELLLWQSFVSGFSDLIQFFYGLTVSLGIGNYGLAIILITLLLKLLLYPLSNKQMESVRAMQEIQPKIKEIQDKYKKEPEKAQQAMVELYKKHKINPLAGCFPVLVQMPILIAFYQALLHLEFDQSNAGFLWISNLGEPDKTFILSILAAGATFWQQKISMPSTNDQTQRFMLMFMPVFIGYLSYTFPAGLALYWVIFSVTSALQQLYINWKRDRKDRGDSVEKIKEASPVSKSGVKRKKGDKKKHAR